MKRQLKKRDVVVVGGSEVGHVAAVENITGELSRLVIGDKNRCRNCEGADGAWSKYEAHLMTVITENAHNPHHQVDVLPSYGRCSLPPGRSMPGDCR